MFRAIFLLSINTIVFLSAQAPALLRTGAEELGGVSCPGATTTLLSCAACAVLLSCAACATLTAMAGGRLAGSGNDAATPTGKKEN